MVELVRGDIFQSRAQTLVNTVNTVGVMGKGVALEFRKRFHPMYEDYVRRCARGEVRLGRPYLYAGETTPWVLNFPTKDHWRSVSHLDDIVAGLQHLERHYREWDITSLAVPPLGCGNGQLEWQVVEPVLRHYLQRLDIPVELYAPTNAASGQLELPLRSDTREQVKSDGRDSEAHGLYPSWVAIAAIVERIHRQPYRAPIGRVMLQKMAYFASVAGIPTELEFERGSFGPFASQLKPVLTRLVNNGVLHERQEGRSFAVSPGEGYLAAAEVWKDDLAHWDTSIERVVDLFMRLRDTRQAEVAATVHFAAGELERQRGQAPSELQVFDAVREWKRRRENPPRDEEIAETIRNLNMLDWLRVPVSDDLPIGEDDEMLYA